MPNQLARLLRLISLTSLTSRLTQRHAHTFSPLQLTHSNACKFCCMHAPEATRYCEHLASTLQPRPLLLSKATRLERAKDPV